MIIRSYWSIVLSVGALNIWKKLNVSTTPTSSAARRRATRPEAYVQAEPLVHNEWISSTLNLGGTRLPTYCQLTGVPSSKFHAYANHSVDSRIAGSVISQ